VLLRRHHGDVEHAELNGEDWFRVAAYPLPAGWRLGEAAIETTPVIFKLAATYPTAQPYGFCLPTGVNFKGAAPNNCAALPASPFGGSWLLFSWQPDGNWAPTEQAEGGSNLLSWVRSFAHRLKEGI